MAGSVPTVGQLYVEPRGKLLFVISTHNPLCGPNPGRITFFTEDQHIPVQCDLKTWQQKKPRRVTKEESVPESARERLKHLFGGGDSATAGESTTV